MLIPIALAATLALNLQIRQQDALDQALFDAVRKNDVIAVKAALEKGGRPNAYSRDWEHTAVAQAAFDSDADVLAVLLKSGGNPNWKDSDGNTPLHLAVHWSRNVDFGTGYREKNTGPTIQLLVSAGARSNATNKLGMTPLMY